MKVEVTLINATRGYKIDTFYEDVDADKKGDIYRFAMKKYGACISKIYIDTKEGVKHVGWVFRKAKRYSDTGEKFIREAWVCPVKREIVVEYTLDSLD